MKNPFKGILNNGVPKTDVGIVAAAVDKVADTVQSFSPKKQAANVHNTDMLSDNKLSKNIRPLTILWLLALFTYTLIDKEISEAAQNTIHYTLLLCLGFYFPGRDIVKTFAKQNKDNGKKEN